MSVCTQNPFPASKPCRTCSPALACHLIPHGHPLGPKGLLHQPIRTSGLSMDDAEVLDGQHSSACCGFYSLQDIRKDVSPLVVARWAAPSLKASGAPCLQMELVGAVGEGCSPRGQFSTLSLHFVLTVLWPRVHRGGLPWGAGRPQRDGLDWGSGKLGDFLSMGVLVWLGRVYCVLQGTVQPPQVEPA